MINVHRENLATSKMFIVMLQMGERVGKNRRIESAAERDDVARRLSCDVFEFCEPRSENRGAEGHPSLNWPKLASRS